MSEPRLVLLPHAERDMAAARRWYNRQRRGLGHRFLLQVDACLERIRQHPSRFRLFHLNYRFAVLKRFPFKVVYRVFGQAIVVYAVYHHRRDPEVLLKRL